MEIEKRLKLVILGQENSGKTTLIESLKDYLITGRIDFQSNVELEKMNRDVGISCQDFKYSNGEIGGNINLKILDFEGNNVYIPLQQHFISSRSIFLISWNLRADIMNVRIAYWLSVISLYAPGSPVFLIGTHLDRANRRLRQIAVDEYNSLRRDFENIVAYHGVSLLKGNGIKDLFRSIQNSIETHPQLIVDISNEARFLESTLMRFKERKQEAKTPLVSIGDEYFQVSQRCGIEDNMVIPTAKLLQELGSVIIHTVINEEEETLSVVVLDLNWIIDILNTIIINRNRANNGILQVDILVNVVWSHLNYMPASENQLIDILERFEFIYKIPDQENILIPSLLPEFCFNLQGIWPTYDPNSSSFTRYYSCEFILGGFFSRLIIRICRDYHYLRSWLYGIVVEEEGYIGLIQIDVIKKMISVTTRSRTYGVYPITLFTKLTELVEAMIEYEFQLKMTIQFPCSLCLEKLNHSPHLFSIDDITLAISDDKLLECKDFCSIDRADEIHKVPVFNVAPDYSMSDFDEEQIVFEDIELGLVIGQGAFADVYKALYKGEVCAVKIIKNDGETSERILQNEFRHEVRAMSGLSHPNLVGFKGFCTKPKRTLVLEYAPLGSLYSFLHKDNSKTPITWELRLRIALDIATGMDFLHAITPPLVHRDFKSPNLMMVSNDYSAPVTAQIADFGLSKPLYTNNFFEGKRLVDNPTWLAPEILQGKSFGTAADVYPFGIVLWELLTKEIPFSDIKFSYIKERQIKEGLRPNIPDSCPQSYAEIIRKCWAAQPSARPSFSTISQILLPASCNAIIPSFYEQVIEPIIDEPLTKTRSDTSSNLNFTPILQKSVKALQNLPAPLVSKYNENIDLRYLSSKIIVGRSPKDDLERVLYSKFLYDRHEKDYKVYNLGEVYDYSSYIGSVAEYKIDLNDMSFPSIIECLSDILSWCEDGDDNVVFIQGGQKTKDWDLIALISCCALALIHKLTCAEVVNRFEKSISNISSPNVKRYIRYYFKSISFNPSSRKSSPIFSLHKIVLNSIPNFNMFGGCDPYFSIKQNGTEVFFSKKLHDVKGSTQTQFFTRDIVVAGDIKISFFHRNSRNIMFTFTVNPSFEQNVASLSFSKNDLVLAKSDSSKFREDFVVKIYFLTLDNLKTARSGLRRSGILDALAFFRNLQHSNESLDMYDNFCDICNSIILDGEMSFSLSNYIVHYRCLQCSTCGRYLHNSDANPIIANGMVNCSSCDPSFFNECDLCGKKIIDDKFVFIEDTYWHTDHFSCHDCGDLINGEDDFNVFEGSPHCLNCSPTPVHHSKDDTIDYQLLYSLYDEIHAMLNNQEMKGFAQLYFSRTGNMNFVNLIQDLVKRKRSDSQTSNETDNRIKGKYLNPENTDFVPVSDVDVQHHYEENLSSLSVVAIESLQKCLSDFQNSMEYSEYMIFMAPSFEKIDQEEEALKEAASLFIPPEPIFNNMVTGEMDFDAEDIFEVDSIEKKKRRRGILKGLRKRITSVRRNSIENDLPIEFGLNAITQVSPRIQREDNLSPWSRQRHNKEEGRMNFMGNNRRHSTILNPLTLDDKPTTIVEQNIKCAVCEGIINNNVYLIIGEDSIHDTCFRCQLCGDPISVGTEVVKKLGKYYCKSKCLVEIVEKCAKCGDALLSDSILLRNERYHPHCMKCTKCRREIDTQVYLIADMPYCVQCGDEMDIQIINQV